MTPMPDFARMTDFPYLSASLSGIFGAVMLVIAGLLWRRAVSWLQQIMADVKVTRDQTTNSHRTNLRDDITQIALAVDKVARAQEATAKKCDEIAEYQRAAHEDVRELRRDVRFATEYARDVDKRLSERERDNASVIAFGRSLMESESKE